MNAAVGEKGERPWIRGSRCFVFGACHSSRRCDGLASFCLGLRVSPIFSLFRTRSKRVFTWRRETSRRRWKIVDDFSNAACPLDRASLTTTFLPFSRLSLFHVSLYSAAIYFLTPCRCEEQQAGCKLTIHDSSGPKYSPRRLSSHKAHGRDLLSFAFFFS